MSDSQPTPASLKHPASLRFAPFGQHTRFVLAAYLRRVLMVLGVLLAIGLTIDLWPQFQQVAAHDGATGIAAIWNVIRFAGLRIPGLIAPLVAFAAFLGVLWTEIAHTQSGERMLVWNSGRSPLDCLAPILLLGAILGIATFFLDGVLRPASMVTQMHEQLGLDGARMSRAIAKHNRWITLPDGLLKADIAFKPEVTLHNLTFFRHDAEGRLIEVLMARRATHQKGHRWLLQHGKYWHAPRHKDVRTIVNLDDSATVPMQPFESRTVTIAADIIWLKFYGVETKYLPLSVLRPLAHSDYIPQDASEYSTRLQSLYGGSLLPGAMALFAATLCMLLLAYTTPALRIVMIVFAGYAAHFATKACLLLGMKAAVPAIIAGWLMPVVMIALSIALLWRSEVKRKL